MIIGIDGFEANTAHRVGIGRYAFEILNHIYRIEKNAHLHDQFLIYLAGNPLHDLPPETHWWQYRISQLVRFRTFIGLPLALMKEKTKPAVFFSPTHYAPRFISIPRVISVMDLSYLKFPDLFCKKDLYQLTRWTAWSIAHARRVLTISEHSKNDIIMAYNIASDRVTVTYPGLGTMTDLKYTRQTIAARYGISKNYILSVGTIQPRKNFARLIEAFAGFLQKNRQKFADIQLIIIGKKGWLYEEILSAPRRFGVDKSVKFLDFVPDDDLPSFYSHALCFALPSLYEGFGLPVAEAMSYGCPVVVSNVSSLPEIAGKAGIYVDPNNSDSITGGLLTAIRQRNLIQGRERIQRGKTWIKKFSWEKAAEKTLQVLKEVGGSSS